MLQPRFTPFPALLIFVLLCLSSCREDPCDSIDCINGGSCVEGICDCPEGFEGVRCEILDQQQHFGTYLADYQGCINTSPEHRVFIRRVDSSSLQLRIQQLGDYACPLDTLEILADLSGNSVNIDTQVVDCGPILYEFSGSGAFSSAGQLSLDFSVAYSDGISERRDDCRVKLERN